MIAATAMMAVIIDKSMISHPFKLSIPYPGERDKEVQND